MDCALRGQSMDCATTHASNVRAKEEEREQGDRSRERKVKLIMAYLSAGDPHFKFWVNSLGFRLLDYLALGLRNVLCLPAKKTLWTLDYTLY